MEVSFEDKHPGNAEDEVERKTVGLAGIWRSQDDRSRHQSSILVAKKSIEYIYTHNRFAQVIYRLYRSESLSNAIKGETRM